LQVGNRAIRKLSRHDSAIAGGGFKQALDPLLQFDMERAGRRHCYDLAIVQFMPCGGFGVFRQL
jgi:hypothetical protein